MQPYKLLVLDIDGTLSNSDKQITQRTLETLERVQQSGIRLVLASGRPTYGIAPLAEQLGMARYGGYILSFNGGKIIEAEGMKTLYEQVLPRTLVPEIYAAAKQAGAVTLSYRNQYIITEQPEDRYVQHEIFLTKMEVERVSDFCAAVDFDPDKCLIVGDPERIVPLGEQLNKAFGEQLSAYRSEPFFLEVTPRGIDKALSLVRLLKHLGLGREQMVAMGDGFNDISMIELAGMGVAMANAQQSVKDAANHITRLTNDQDGVADFCEKYLL